MRMFVSPVVFCLFFLFSNVCFNAYAQLHGEIFLAAGGYFLSGQVTFSDETSNAGVLYIQQDPLIDYCSFEGEFSNVGCSHRPMTGGIAVGDYDNDGLDDLICTRMSKTDILFKNNGDGTFQDMSSNVGLTQILDTNGVAFSDVDNDGDLDIYFSTVGDTRYYFYLNNGNGTFSEDGAARGLALNEGFNEHYGWSIAVGDYNKDGFQDFCTSEWNQSGANTQPSLLLNRGLEAPGYFTNETANAGIDTFNEVNSSYFFAPAFVDLDLDGWQDLAIASDFGNSQLFWNNGDGTFSDEAGTASIGTDENGMGSTFGDIDNNGYLDWFVTSIWDNCTDSCSVGPTGNRLYLNNGDRTFTDATDAFGVRNGDWGWGASMFDFDNDSDLDIVMTNGIDLVLTNIDTFWNTDMMRLWENNGDGTTTEIGGVAGVNDQGQGKGLVTFDYDIDGDLDVMVANTSAPSVLYRNNGGNAQDWMRISFTAANRPFEGLNAKIRLQASAGGLVQIREMGVATHFLGQSERVAHFGLGAPSATPVHEITVEWPLTGQIQTFNDVPRNQTFVITAPTGEVIDPPHSADANADFMLGLSELLRIIQFFNCGEYHVDATGQDGFNCGPGAQTGFHHSSDFNVPDWTIGLPELLRGIQFFNSPGFHRHFSGEDGYVTNSAV